MSKELSRRAMDPDQALAEAEQAAHWATRDYELALRLHGEVLRALLARTTPPAEKPSRTDEKRNGWGIWDVEADAWLLDCFDEPHNWALRRDAVRYFELRGGDSKRFVVKRYEPAEKPSSDAAVKAALIAAIQLARGAGLNAQADRILDDMNRALATEKPEPSAAELHDPLLDDPSNKPGPAFIGRHLFNGGPCIHCGETDPNTRRGCYRVRKEPSAAVGEGPTDEELEQLFDDAYEKVKTGKSAYRVLYEAGLSAGRAELDRVHRAINNRAPHDKMADCVVEWIETAKERIAELEAGRAERGDGWKLASEEAPYQVKLLVAVQHDGGTFVAFGHCDPTAPQTWWHIDVMGHSEQSGEDGCVVTHWRELPPLPDAAKEELPASGREG